MYERLKKYGKFTGLCWILSPEPITPTTTLHIPAVEELITSDDFLCLNGITQQRVLLEKKMRLTTTCINSVSTLTVGQRDNPLWHNARKNRLTASSFGHVLNAKRATPSLIKKILGEYDIASVKAVAWGVTNEDEGIKAFECRSGLKVEKTGLWLHESGVLGASPDGLIGQNHVVEVKCPYAHRNSTIEQTLGHDGFCLTKNKEGLITLKENHIYWHQVQGQLYLTNRLFCYFIVWTVKYSVSVLVKRDKELENNLFFYYKIFIFYIFSLKS